MICPSCRQAGRALSVGLDTTIARELHKQCPAIRTGSTSQCTCQHSTNASLTQKVNDNAATVTSKET